MLLSLKYPLDLSIFACTVWTCDRTFSSWKRELQCNSSAELVSQLWPRFSSVRLSLVRRTFRKENRGTLSHLFWWIWLLLFCMWDLLFQLQVKDFRGCGEFKLKHLLLNKSSVKHNQCELACDCLSPVEQKRWYQMTSYHKSVRTRLTRLTQLTQLTQWTPQKCVSVPRLSLHAYLF